MLYLDMTTSEILKEVISEKKELIKSIYNNLSRNHRKYKDAKFPLGYCATIQTKSKTLYYVQYFYWTRSDWRKREPYIEIYADCIDRNTGALGMYYLFEIKKEVKMSRLVRFYPHLFQRFKTRMNLDLSDLELRVRYLQHNVYQSFGFANGLEEGKDDIPIINCSEDGVSLGWYCPDQIMYNYKTFISYSMLTDTQKQKAKMIMDFHEKLIEENQRTNIDKLKPREEYQKHLAEKYMEIMNFAVELSAKHKFNYRQ